MFNFVRPVNHVAACVSISATSVRNCNKKQKSEFLMEKTLCPNASVLQVCMHCEGCKLNLFAEMAPISCVHVRARAFKFLWRACDVAVFLWGPSLLSAVGWQPD